MSGGLGLDLGTGLTKLACAAANGQEGEAGVTPVRMAQTAVTYHGPTARIPLIGPGSEPGARSPGEDRYDGFPVMLDDGSEAWPAGPGRLPAEIAHEFLRLFLDAGERANAGASSAPLAAAVPPGGRAGELAAILTALGRPSPRLLATPVAILLYLRHSRPEIAPATRFVVCDLGAGSVTLSLCAVTGQQIRVVDSAQVTGTSSWETDTRGYADVGERLPMLIEGLAVALTENAGTPETDAQVMSVRRWRELEQALSDDGQRARLDAVLEQALADPTRYAGTVALRIGDVAVTAAQFLRACDPVADRCATELTRLLRRQGDPAWRRPGAAATTRVVLAGGLGVLSPVRAALLRAAGLRSAASGGALELDDTERLYAPAFGAALVSAGLADPGDRYPHALRLPVHRQVRGQIVTSHLELAASGSIALDREDPVFAQAEGESIQVLIRASGDADPGYPVPVEVVMADSDTAEPAAFSPAPAPPPGVYHIGVRGHPSGAAVVLQPVDGGKLLSYPLAGQGTAPQTNGSE
jgi:hypothetical protein